jgi:hypothetical protein
MWFNLGHGAKPHAGRKSKYFEAWARANGGQPPKRADRLPESVFLRRIAKVRVEEVNALIPYSIVREILEWETGTVSTINKSIIINQQSIINNQQSSKASVKGFGSRDLHGRLVNGERVVFLRKKDSSTSVGPSRGREYPTQSNSRAGWATTHPAKALYAESSQSRREVDRV